MTTSTDQITQRLDRIEAMLEQLTATYQMAPPMVSMLIDTVDEVAAKSTKQGISIEERVKSIGSILSRLSEPGTADKIHGLLDMVELTPGMVSMATDVFDEYARDSALSGISLDERIHGMLNIFNKLTDPGMIGKIDTLIQLSDQIPGLIAMTVDSIDEVARGTHYLGPQNLTLIKTAIQANQYAFTTEPTKVGGIFGILKILKDEDVQKMLGFLVNFAKAFGKKIDQNNQ